MRIVASSAMCLSLLAAFGSAEAQETTPVNGIFASITGPAAEPSLFYAVNLTTYQAISANVKFSEEGSKPKLNLAPLKFNPTCQGLICELTLNIAQVSGVSTFGVGWSYDQGSPYAPWNASLIQQAGADLPPEPPRENYATEEEYKQALASYDEEVLMKRFYTRVYEQLAHRSWRFTTGLNLQTFSTLFGDGVDADADGLIDNAHSLKGWDFAAGASYSHNTALGATVNFHRSRKRKSAVEDRQLANYNGVSISAAYRVAVLDPEYRISEPYLKTLFVPSVVVGAAWESQWCGAQDLRMCEDDTQRKIVVTPFLDVRVTPEAQFRIGFPVTTTRMLENKQATEAGAFLQLNFGSSSI